MGADHRAVDAPQLVVERLRVGHRRLETIDHLVQRAVGTPPVEPAVHGLPGTKVLFGKVPPWRACAQNPQDPVHHLPQIGPRPARIGWRRKERGNALSLFVRKSMPGHGHLRPWRSEN